MLSVGQQTTEIIIKRAGRLRQIYEYLLSKFLLRLMLRFLGIRSLIKTLFKGNTNLFQGNKVLSQIKIISTLVHVPWTTQTQDTLHNNVTFVNVMAILNLSVERNSELSLKLNSKYNAKHVTDMATLLINVKADHYNLALTIPVYRQTPLG